jgi:hypothetical protein
MDPEKPMIEFLESRIAPATFLVTNLNDAGQGSLRDAIAQANDRPGADLIVFKAGLTGMINVASGQMAITDTLTLKGPGADKLALNAFIQSRIFLVSDGENSKDSRLSVSGLSLFAGAVNGGGGGAISSVESLSVKGCVFMDNRAELSGGAIEVLQVSGELPLQVDIRKSTFRFNGSADGSGGAVSVEVTGAVNLKGNVFSTNFATRGGAVFIEGVAEETVLLQKCRFISNSANQDGAVIVESESAGTVVVRDSLFADNTSAVADSGALTVVDGNVIVERSAFTRNTGQDGSGALQLEQISSLFIHSSRFLDNDSLGNGSEVGGGGLKVSLADDGPARIIASIISGNTASQGGGILVTNGPGTLKVIDSKITNNRATGNGGGILVQEDPVSHEGAGLNIARSKIIGNVSENGNGGGLANLGNGEFIVQLSQVTQNSALTGGGGVYIHKTTPSVIVGSVIAQNTARDGGGIIADSALELLNSRVLDNIAENLGGGVRFFGNGELALELSIVSGNVAVFGGGIFTNKPVSATNTKITGNFSSDGEQVVID